MTDSYSFDTSNTPSPRSVPFVVGKTGPITATADWAPTSPFPATGTASPSLPGVGSNTTYPQSVAGASELAATATWAQAAGTVSSSSAQSVATGAAGTYWPTFTPNTGGAFTATGSWNPIDKVYSVPSGTATLSTNGTSWTQTINVSNGNFAVNLSWPFQAFNDPNLDLQILDGTTPVGTGGATSFYGNDRETVSGSVSGLAVNQTKALTVKVTKIGGATTSFTIGNDLLGNPSHYQTIPTVGLELRNSTGVFVAGSTPVSGQNARTITATLTGGTVYKLWASTTDAVTVTAAQTVPDLAYAPLKLEFFGPAGNFNVSGSTGALALPTTLVAQGGAYTVKVTNQSTSASTHPATPTLNWSATTRGSDVGIGALARSQTTPDYSFTTGTAPGTLSAALSWTKDPEETNFASVTMTLKTAAGGTILAQPSSSGSMSFTSPLAANTTYKVSITNNSSTQAVRSYTRTLTRPSQGAVTLVIKDANGATVATGQGLKPVTVNVGLAPGNYTATTTPVSGAGSATLTGSYAARPASVTTTFDANDHATVVNDGTTTVTETLAPSGRVLRRRVAPTNNLAATTEDNLFFYDDGGDSPAYSQPTSGGTLTTYLGGAIDVGGVITYQHANGHGDVIGTSNSAGTFTERPAPDEYGLDTVQPADRLGWLGKQQRFTVGLANLTRMGVRLYDPTSGRFTSVDPIEGGSSNDYDYVDGDPVNALDLDGSACLGHLCVKVKKPNFKKLAQTAVAKGAGMAAKFAAASATTVRGTMLHVDRYGGVVLKQLDAKRVVLSGSRLAFIAGGATQLIADGFNRKLSVVARVGRATLSAGAAAGGAALGGAAVAAGCTFGGCELLAAAGAGFVLYKGASMVSRRVGWGRM